MMCTELLYRRFESTDVPRKYDILMKIDHTNRKIYSGYSQTLGIPKIADYSLYSATFMAEAEDLNMPMIEMEAANDGV